ncbi:hypothetical protein Q5741_00945 [Paenibacillus sp. JX-17]|uniref:Uncharacterized protein n=1 Tax=Paenibacillus lacisoli TaxID=3064525 RepID=A0ABT9CBA9_9BACL|nr:hypothetical protein [Paenibacillus sp. JX-17]MDO7904976.1 hypothetical protein [Paenibacillus sp. JX-17]
MRRKIEVTPKEYDELKRLAKIVNDTTAPVGQRRLAKAEYEAILRLAKNRPSTPMRSTHTVRAF